MNPAALNRKIEAFIDLHLESGKPLTASKKMLLAHYSGAGGKANKGARGEGLLHEFYTPEWLCSMMWELANFHGYDGGAVLDPSAGTGRFLKDAPTSAPIHAFEINAYSAFILKTLYPKAHLHNHHFETAFLTPERFSSKYTQAATWLEHYPFSLVITNPPYGKYGGMYATYFQKPKFRQFESFFIYHSLRLLKPGGLLVMVIPSSFLRNGSTYEKEKERIGELADLVDAYRLPEVFESTAIPTDIIVLKKKTK